MYAKHGQTPIMYAPIKVTFDRYVYDKPIPCLLVLESLVTPLNWIERYMESVPTIEDCTIPIRPFGCLRCPDVLFDTTQEVITHFRIKHGIKPEQFSAEKRRRFYNSFKRNEDRPVKSVTLLDGSPPVTTENNCGETPDHEKNNVRKRHGISPELSAKKRKTFPNISQFEAETTEIGKDEMPEDMPLEETVTTVTNDDTFHSRIEQDNDSSQSSPIADTEQSSQVIQQASKVVTKRKSSLIDCKPGKQTSTSSTKQSNPLSGTIYRCPHCSRCMGYAILQLQRHHSRFSGSCVTCKTKDDHFICSHCKTDFANEFTMTKHIKRFNGKCKQYQIDQSNRYFKRKTDGDYLLGLVKEDNESPPTTEPTIEEDDTRIQLQPFKHKGHIIPAENNYYKCPWCLRIFGNRQGPVRRHLASTTGVCHREKISDNLPQCFVCKSHFSSIVGLLRHTNNFRGNCTILESVKDHDTVDVINSIKRSKKKRHSSDKQDLFYCKHCNRCMGYCYNNLRNHLFVTQGKCKPDPLRATYPCQDCQFDFTSTSSLKRHTTRFNGECIDEN